MSGISKETIRAYALENALKHSGKANSGAVLSGLFSQGLEKSEIKEIMPQINEILKEINSLSEDKQKSEFEKLKELVSKREVREGLPELPNAEDGKVIMRIAPFPSGPLHIGNARQAVLNSEYVKKYHGKYLLAIDDTIGSDEKRIEPEAYELIEEGLKWLGCKFSGKTVYKSDRNEIYYAYAEEMLKKGYLYACSCPAEEFRELKIKGQACPCRHLPPTTHLERWKKMFDKKQTKEGDMVIRLKTDMQYPDPAFRDRVMFKISDATHPLTKNKYRVYPTMEFSWAFDDHLLGMTHIIRGIELMMETQVEKFIWDIFKWPHPEVIHTGHLVLEGVKISKSKGTKEVKSGQYTGWNDPRLWSLQSLRDRGFKPEAVTEFIVSQGIRKSATTVPIDVLYSINKKYLGEVKRLTFIENPTKIKISGAPERTINLKFNKQKPELGNRLIEVSQEFYIPTIEAEILQEDNVYNLIDLYSINTFRDAKFKPLRYHYHDDALQKNTKSLLWLPANAKNINVKIRMENGDLIEGLAEETLQNFNEKDEVYFEQFGYCNLYKKHKDHLEFFFTHT